MKRVIIIIVLLIYLMFIPIYGYAENDHLQIQGASTQVRVVATATVIFQNEDKIVKQKIEIGQKLEEPSHLEIDGYIFDGWYDGGHQWDFEKDVVTDHLTLIAKYMPIENHTIHIMVDEKSIMQPSILNKADLEAEFEGINSNNRIDILLQVKDAENIITKSEKQKFEKVFKQKGLILGKYIDISMFMELNQDQTTKKEIYETKNKIKIQITIPKDMRYNNKKYYILRLYDDAVETIYEGFPSKDWEVTFETDKFSLYAIAFSDDNYTNPNINPRTGDYIILWISLIVVSILGFALIILYTKKKNKDTISDNK